jgi:hypothetical protein
MLEILLIVVEEEHLSRVGSLLVGTALERAVGCESLCTRSHVQTSGKRGAAAGVECGGDGILILSKFENHRWRHARRSHTSSTSTAWVLGHAPALGPGCSACVWPHDR